MPVESSLAAFIGALGAAIIPWVTWGIAKLLPRIPRAALPLLVMGLAMVADVLAQMATGQKNPLGAAGIALAALVLRETIHSLTQHGLGGGGGEVIGATGKQPFLKREW